MPMPISTLIDKIKRDPTQIQFAELMQLIDQNYHYTPVRFMNGDAENEAGSNEGACKIFAFAALHNLSQEQTLHCFGDFYRVDVLGNPDGDDHANIRNFMVTGWSAVSFDGVALVEK